MTNSNMKKVIKKHLEIGEEGHLSDLEKSQSGIVLALHNNEPSLRRRLLDMGITKGVTITIDGFAPLGDPVNVRLRGYNLAIRLFDMSQIDIKRIG